MKAAHRVHHTRRGVAVAFDAPVILEVVDDVADGRVGAVLQQPHFRPLTRPGEVTLQSRCSRVKHAMVLVSLGGGGRKRRRGCFQNACTQQNTFKRTRAAARA